MAHASLIGMRARGIQHDFKLPLNLRINGRDIPMTAVIGGLGTLGVWLLIVVTHPFGRWAGLGWMLAGVVLYVAYRRKMKLSISHTTTRQFEEG